MKLVRNVLETFTQLFFFATFVMASPIHNTQHATHNTQHATRTTQPATHNTQHATHKTQHAANNTQHATHNTHTHNTHRRRLHRRRSSSLRTRTSTASTPLPLLAMTARATLSKAWRSRSLGPSPARSAASIHAQSAKGLRGATSKVLCKMTHCPRSFKAEPKIFQSVTPERFQRCDVESVSRDVSLMQ